MQKKKTLIFASLFILLIGVSSAYLYYQIQRTDCLNWTTSWFKKERATGRGPVMAKNTALTMELIYSTCMNRKHLLYIDAFISSDKSTQQALTTMYSEIEGK